MRILVTGGAGFIGWHIVKKLLQKHMQVVVVDDLSSGLATNLHADVRFIQMDIGNDKILGVFQEQKFDMVIHLAAQTLVPASLEDPKHDGRVNILGTINILEACRQTGVKRIVFASTAAMYGSSAALPITEEAEKSPESFYGLSKLTVEQYLHLYNQLYGLEYVVLRAANVYGERQGDGGEGGVVSIFIRNIRSGAAVSVLGDGNQTRDFIYVGDVAEAYFQSLITNCVNTAYNISTQRETSLNGLIDLLGQIAGKPVIKEYKAPRTGDIYRSVLANEKASVNLEWHFATSLREGLKICLKE